MPKQQPKDAPVTDAKQETPANEEASPAILPPAERDSPHVIQGIQYVQGRFSQTGLEKNRDNKQQGFKFRGIDDVYNSLSTFLVEANIVILPRVLSRETTERATKREGGVLIYTTVEVEYKFVSSIDGSEMVVGPMYGEAMDSGDKSTNKAMSAAYKYLCLQTFCIPTEGDNDADATTHEVAPKQQAPRREPAPQREAPPAQQAARQAPADRPAPTNQPQRPTRDTGPKKPVAFHLNAIRSATNDAELRAAFGLAWKQYEGPDGPGTITDAQKRFKDEYNARREELIAPTDEAQQDAFDEAGGEADQQQAEVAREEGADGEDEFWPEGA